ncbi:HAD family hydrolase [Streptomyces sp.]|uniref:HAD family hydrolase n=1 Tax=Streptomyces sp. TaxID=1931 RepID=UPI002D787A0D|nr:HAD family hydrolase [Streptomyces sp.]HET6354869.1 HAD family hydrolase [Streptomyces sp.]
MGRLALFDLDGTLVDRRAAFTVCVTELCATAGYSPEIEAWMLSELADRARPEDFARMRDAFGLAEHAAQLWQTYVTAMASAVSCRPEVLQALAELRDGGWTIGVVTNGASDIQRAKLSATGIADLIDGVAVSGDIEVRKPARELFELAAKQCGTKLADGGWAVGDNPAADIGGAHQAGLRSIWLRGRPWPTGLANPDHAVDDVLDAIAILLTDSSE